MKNILAYILLLTLIAACGGSDSKKEEPELKDNTKHPDYQKGLALVSKSNCFTCHKIDDKLIGPPYRDIANKYSNSEDVVSSLAGKIIKGSVGVWGTVPMQPRTDLGEDDAKAMVRYILLLKK
jgi:cytochrome c